MGGAVELLGETKASVLKVLLGGESSAEQIAANVGVDASAVRRHLHELSSANLTSGRFLRRGKGRPKKLYSITIQGRELFHSMYGTLLSDVIHSINRYRGQEETRKLLELAADELVNRNKKQNPGQTPLSVLERLGFHPSEQLDGGMHSVESANCPVFRLAVAYPALVCGRYHEVLLKQIYGAKRVSLQRTMAKGDRRCSHLLDSQQDIVIEESAESRFSEQ